MSAPINLNQAIFALTDALDLVGIDEVRHGKRVGYMAFRCAEAMGLGKAGRERLFDIGMLHDCGVSSSRVHAHLAREMQWEHAQAHAIDGALLIDSFPRFCGFAEVIRYHHTPWRDLERMGDLDASVRADANLIFLMDRVDVMGALCQGADLLERADAIKATVKGFSGTLFSPELVEVFTWAARSEAFWLMLEPPHLDKFLVDMGRFTTPELVDFDSVKHLARLFSCIVDAKSAFTRHHSNGVAQLARYLGQRLGLGDATLDKIEVAGLLHDLGKLRVPDEVLEKPGKLDARDLQIMRQHSFETYQVLRGIGGFEDIALWAAYHHETPDGEGYPFHRRGQDLSIEARIIAVADVFQALAQDRPYRSATPINRIPEILTDMARRGRLDSVIVALVTAEADACLHWATKALCPTGAAGNKRGRSAAVPLRRTKRPS
jgi:HD-GYP domain-containing protein (c-di-GMP phosphodiesterase class II)